MSHRSLRMLCLKGFCTCASRRVWLPEVATTDFRAGDFVGTPQDVAGVTLEYHVVPRLPAVTAAGPISRHARVIA